MHADRLLIAGQTCVERADQFACIVDAADYFRHAMLNARHRIMLVGWDFDARTTFERGAKTLPGPNQLAAFLYWLRSNLRLLPAFDAIWYGITPVSVVNRLSSKRIHIAVDGAHPTGAVHHQKLALIDDAPRPISRWTRSTAPMRSGRTTSNRLERETMDGARHRLIHELWAADAHGRLGVYWPETDDGSTIYVHSKLLVVDDRLLRVGSSNLNNRSMGFDSECDIAVEADPKSESHDDVRQAIKAVRQRLVCEHLGCDSR